MFSVEIYFARLYYLRVSSTSVTTSPTNPETLKWCKYWWEGFDFQHSLASIDRLGLCRKQMILMWWIIPSEVMSTYQTARLCFLPPDYKPVNRRTEVCCLSTLHISSLCFVPGPRWHSDFKLTLFKSALTFYDYKFIGIFLYFKGNKLFLFSPKLVRSLWILSM